MFDSRRRSASTRTNVERLQNTWMLTRTNAFSILPTSNTSSSLSPSPSFPATLHDSLFWIFISSVIPGNRIQPDAHAESGSTWLTFNYNYGSLMPINWRMVSHYHRRWLHARHGVAFALNILLRLKKKKKKNESLIQGKTSFRRTRKFRLSHCRLHVRVKKNFLFFFIFIRVPLSSHYTPSLFLSSFFRRRGSFKMAI